MKNFTILFICCITNFQLYSQSQLKIMFDTGAVYFDLLADTQHIWQVGPPQKSILDSAYTKPNVLITDTILPYSNNTNAFTEILIPKLYCWGIRFNFNYKIDSEKNKDGLKIEMSFDHNDWFNVAYHDSFPYEYFYSTMMFSGDTLFTGEPGITGSDRAWHNFDLEADYFVPVRKTYSSINDFDSLWFKFTFLSDSINTGEGFMMDNFIINFNCGGNIHDLENEMIFIYPNPVQNILHIENKLNKYYRVKIFSDVSYLVQDLFVDRTNVDIDITSFPKGMYMLQLIDDKDQITYKKFIKD